MRNPLLIQWAADSGVGGRNPGATPCRLQADDQIIHGLQQARMIELRGNAHGDGEVVVADPGDVDAGNGDDGVEILECADTFRVE